MKIEIDLACKTICVKESITVKELWAFIDKLGINVDEWCIVRDGWYGSHIDMKKDK